MSLYDDVLTDFTLPTNANNNESTINNNNNNNNQTNSASTNNDIASLKLLQFQIEAAKKRQQLNSSLQQKRDRVAPVVNLGGNQRRSLQPLNKPNNNETKIINFQSPSPNITKSSNDSIRFNSLTGKIEKDDSSLFVGLNEEYDPLRPNDYEKLVEELKKLTNNYNNNGNGKNRNRSTSSSDDRSSRSSSRNRHRKRSRDRSRDRDYDRRKGHRRHRSSSRSSSDDDRYSKRSDHRKRRHDEKDDDRDRSYSQSSSSNKRAAFIPPPASLLEEIKPAISSSDSNDENKQSKPVLGGLMKAEKMMQKMGYKEGEGLGKNKQGMSVALQVEKTGKLSGRIIHEKDIITEQVIQPSPVSTIVTTNTNTSPGPVTIGIPAEVMKNMSKVILLRNMVAPGDVDEDLEIETKEECQKYGEVNKVVIFEIPDKPADEAVRIFVEFKTMPSAIKALTDLNNRFFGGRMVKATFYNYDKFSRLELADIV